MDYFLAPKPLEIAYSLFWLPAAIMATAGLVQSMVQRRNDKKNIERQQAANSALSAQEFNQNQKAISEMNKYNDPSSQMMRLQGAGLNPNLIYGSGASGASGSQGAPARYQGRETDMSLSAPNFSAVGNIPEMISQYQNFQLTQAQIDQTKANTAKIQEQTITEPVARALKDLLRRKGDTEIQKIMALLPYQASAAESQAARQKIGIGLDAQKLSNLRQDELLKLLQREETGGRIGMQSAQKKLMEASTQNKQAELIYQRYKNEWMKAGFTTSDDLGFRFIIRMLNESGLIDSIGPFLKELGGKLKNWKP